MIVSKQNLQVVEVTKADKQIPVLDCVNILDDGTTVGGNGKCFIAVSPVPDVIKEKVAKVYGNSKSSCVNVSSGTINEVLKNIPADRQYNGMLEHAEIESTNGNNIKFVLYDGARKQNIDGKVNPASYPPFENLFKRALTNKQNIQIVLNAKRLLPMLETIVKCSNDSGDFSPMYIEFTSEGEMIVRMQNPKTQQRVVGLMLPYKGIEGKWMENNNWEERLQNGYFNSGDQHLDSNSDRVFNSIDKSNKSRVPVVENSKERCIIQGKQKTGNRQLARIMHDKECKCGLYHIATDGIFEWCSGKKGCGHFERIKK